MRTLANFTRHYPRQSEVRYWHERGYCLDPTPRAPSLDESWGETDIADILGDEMQKIKAQGMGLEVLYARGRKGENGYIITTHSAMLNPSLLAA